jgi:hypothetical protein
MAGRLGRAGAQFTNLEGYDGADNASLSSKYSGIRTVWRAKRESKRHRKFRRLADRLDEQAAFDDVAPIDLFKTGSFSISNSVGQQNMACSPALFCIQGSGTSNDDINDIANMLDINDTLTGMYGNWLREGAIHFLDCRQDLILSADAANTALAILDIWYYEYRQDYLTSGNYVFSSVTPVPVTTGMATMNAVTLGADPFMFPTFIANCRIVNKKTVQMGVSDSITISCSKNGGKFGMDWYNDNIPTAGYSFARAGWTRGFVLRVRGNPISGSASAAVFINGVYTNHYRLKVLPADLQDVARAGVII